MKKTISHIKKFIIYLISIIFEKTLNISTMFIGQDDIGEEVTRFNDAAVCWPTAYPLLIKIGRIISNIVKEPNIIDLGCGTGRAVFYFSYRFRKNVTGIEYDKFVFRLLLTNLNKFRFKNNNIILKNEDVTNYNFVNENIIYIFNPFGIQTLSLVLNNIILSIKKKPREVFLIYVNCVCNDLIKHFPINEIKLNTYGLKDSTKIYKFNNKIIANLNEVI